MLTIHFFPSSLLEYQRAGTPPSRSDHQRRVSACSSPSDFHQKHRIPRSASYCAVFLVSWSTLPGKKSKFRAWRASYHRTLEFDANFSTQAFNIILGYTAYQCVHAGEYLQGNLEWIILVSFRLHVRSETYLFEASYAFQKATQFHSCISNHGSIFSLGV